MKASALLLCLLLLLPHARAGDEAPLDAGAKAVHPVFEEGPFTRTWPSWISDLPPASQLSELIRFQSPVKAQGKRGTCSIFSTVAFLESLSRIHYELPFRYSENHLQFLVVSRLMKEVKEGSDIPLNVPAARAWGAIAETTWPYEPFDWRAEDLPEEEQKRVEATCGELEGEPRSVCLITHADPREDRFAAQADAFRRAHHLYALHYRILRAHAEIRRLLAEGYPLILSLEFFYKAWNHRLVEEYGLGKRDMKLWAKGVVKGPSAEDIRVSRRHPSGHSVLLVGYDDRKRVYFFKNSWGTDGFGKESDLLGPGTTAGYGQISYDYAHHHGTFYDLYKVDLHGRPIRRPP